MKPTENHLRQKRKKNSNTSKPKIDTQSVKTDVKEVEPTKLQSFIKNNKNKLIAVFTLFLGALAGESVGLFDYISAWFGF